MFQCLDELHTPDISALSQVAYDRQVELRHLNTSGTTPTTDHTNRHHASYKQFAKRASNRHVPRAMSEPEKIAANCIPTIVLAGD